ELESVFDFPEELQGMTIRLADSENRVLFSTEQEEIGAAVPEEIAASLGDNGTRSTLTHKNLITTDFCSNGWKVICTIPLKIIMKDRDSAVFYTIVFSLISVGIFLLISFLLFRMISKSLNVLFDKLSEKAELDRLSGLLNKIAYEEQVTELLNQRADDEHALMVVLDVDRFKPINDNLGHARGDEVIAGLGRMLDASFSERYLIGRIGGDEFSVFTLYTAENRVDMRQGVDRILAELRQKFITEFKKENESFGTSMSAGVVLMEEEKDTFDKLYKKADRALYTSKENGKGRTSWYGEVNR
ncbi:MAG: GGDEF domain-containing protein, partial [Clostridiales bacterium]|nr:GGDEF domain-containing protein [Candidatus Blautia equi]